ncbi:MAG: hypothetical protein SFY56_08615 [Bacteroidota bacterium]|nr:hypothetical protein [Bacteroidota bacterium]
MSHLFNTKQNFKRLSLCFVLISTLAFAQKTDSIPQKVQPKKSEPVEVRESSSESTTSSDPIKSKYDNPEHTSEDLLGLKDGWFVGFDGGATLFYGDVALYNNFPKLKDLNKSMGGGVSIFGGKKFKFGLAAEIQLFKGTLKGEKHADNLYQRYFRADLLGYSVSAKYNLSQLMFREKNDRKLFNRLALYINVGAGQTFFRSRLYKLANNNKWYLENTSGFTSSGIDSAGAKSGGGIVTDKVKTISSIIIPVGGKLNFKLNAKTDLVLDVNYVTVFSDQLDAWVRSWSHKDRYLYTGIGLMHNFGNAKSDDIPDEDRFLRPHAKKTKSKKVRGDAYEKSSSTSIGDSSKKGLFKKKEKKEDKDLEIKLKLYELQLKLFEMQYLMK